MKPNILLSKTDLHSFCSYWIVPVLERHFNIIWEEQGNEHNKNNTIIITGELNRHNRWYQKYLDQGYKLARDELWDQPVTNKSIIEDSILKIRLPNWFWYNESLWWRYLGYTNYIKDRNNSKYFLLLMRLQREHRDYLFDNLKNYLENSIYSYVDRGISIHDDIDVNHGDWQRNMNPRWFNDTVFSIVAESMTDRKPSGTFITEKTFKPIAFKHPFIIAGTIESLKYLKSQGFETYDHIIDESYDLIMDTPARLSKIVSEVERLIQDNELFEDKISLEKAEHNQNLFYNDKFVIQELENTIIQDLLNYVEA
jgi:hypothetical protein